MALMNSQFSWIPWFFISTFSRLNQDPSLLPNILRPGSPELDKAEKMLLDETKNFEEQEDKTLDIHEPHRKARLGETFSMTISLPRKKNLNVQLFFVVCSVTNHAFYSITLGPSLFLALAWTLKFDGITTLGNKMVSIKVVLGRIVLVLRYSSRRSSFSSCPVLILVEYRGKSAGQWGDLWIASKT